jgi:hypothetical protein
VEEIAYLANLQVLELNSRGGDYMTRFPVLDGVTFLRALVFHRRNLGVVSIAKVLIPIWLSSQLFSYH